MAFVFGKAEKQMPLESRHQFPGPADYLTRASQNKEETPAPFNSSAFKVSAFDVPPSQTGPGLYDPLTQKELQMSHKKTHMNSSFCSNVQRFKTEPNAVERHKDAQMRVSLIAEESSKIDQGVQWREGRAEAAARAKDKMTTLQSANKQRRTDSIGTNREFVRVILSNPRNTETMHSVFVDASITRKNHEGPGSYNIQNSSDICRRRSSNAADWSKSTNKRFKQKRNKTPGPGAYQMANPSRRVSTSCSSSFAYQGLKSCMDEVIYKTKMPFKVKVIEQKGLKDRYPGPGHYNPAKGGGKSFHYGGEDCFGSTALPTREDDDGLVDPGPGHYQLKDKNSTAKERLKENRQKIFGKSKLKTEKSGGLCEQNKEEIRKQCLLQIEKTKNKFYSLKERCSSKVGDFSSAQRWNAKDRNINPGPGQYYLPRSHSQADSKVQQASVFASTCKEHPPAVQQSVPLPFYDVDRNDMGKAALRARHNIDNLRQIDIEKAPFNSKEQRFTETQQKYPRQEESEMHPSMVSWNPHNEEERARYNITKNSGPQQVQPSASFKSATKRQDGSVVHGPGVGPGAYNCPFSLQKRSFNRQYNYQAPVKIRGTYRARSSME